MRVATRSAAALPFGVSPAFRFAAPSPVACAPGLRGVGLALLDERGYKRTPYGLPLEKIVMPLHVYPDVVSSGSVPRSWRPNARGTLKYPVRNQSLLKHLRDLKAGRWQKVIKPGSVGEVHYFEHASGAVAGVKFFPRKPEAGS